MFGGVYLWSALVLIPLLVGLLIVVRPRLAPAGPLRIVDLALAALLAGVFLRLREHLVFVLALDDCVAAWHDVAATEDLIRHVPPLREGG